MDFLNMEISFELPSTFVKNPSWTSSLGSGKVPSCWNGDLASGFSCWQHGGREQQLLVTCGGIAATCAEMICLQYAFAYKPCFPCGFRRNSWQVTIRSVAEANFQSHSLTRNSAREKLTSSIYSMCRGVRVPGSCWLPLATLDISVYPLSV